MVSNLVDHHLTMVASSKVTMVHLLSSPREDNSNRVGMEGLPKAGRKVKVHRKVKAVTTTAKGLNLSIKVTNFRGRPTIKVSLLFPNACVLSFDLHCILYGRLYFQYPVKTGHGKQSSCGSYRRATPHS
jgi:hypothetical protein